MTKEITKAFILQQIQDKFALREMMPEKFAFSEMVVPVYNIEEHLLTTAVEIETKNITSAAGYLFFRVPENERWTLHRYQVIFLGGTYTVAGAFIGRPDGTTFIYLDLTAAQSVSYANDLPKPAILQPGDGLYVNTDTYSVTGDLSLYIDVTKETIR